MDKISFKNKIPRPIKSVAKKLNMHKLFLNKYTAELEFQRDWAKEFKDNKDMVLEYWKKYRYLDEIKRRCNIKDNSTILDMGCGISTVLHLIKGKKYGIDPLANEYKKVYDYPNDIIVFKSYGEKIPFHRETFDIVFCSNVLDHVSNPKITLNEISRVLKRERGLFVLTIDISKHKTDLAHPHSFDKKDVYNLLKDKFKIIFEKETPWIGLRSYVSGKRYANEKELVLILKKV